VASYQLLTTIRSTWQDGCTILRTEGILPFVRAGLREVNLNHRGFYYYLQYLYKRVSPSYKTAEPLRVIDVDPQRIQRLASRDIDRWKQIGEVRAGDWDLSERSIEELSKYRSVVDRFENGTPWEETDIYREAFERIENGETHWNGCRTVDDIEQRIDHLEQLYETIGDSGFKSQSELHSKSVKSIVLSGSFSRSLTDIAVAIGRDGEFLFVDGNHRLAIAHILQLDEIPTRVVVRHEQWQDIRDEIRSVDNFDQLDERAKHYIGHPDIRHLVPESWPISR